MATSIYQSLEERKKQGKKSFAVLIDPDKVKDADMEQLLELSISAKVDYFFVGGSLVPLGGHNLIEAFAMGKPVLTGPHTFNFSEITDQAIAANSALRVTDALHLMKNAQALLDDAASRINMGENAYAFFLQHQGATDRTLQVLRQFI